MNIVLINPSFNRYAGIKGHGGLSAPLNLACLAAYIREKRSADKISIIDAEAFNFSYEKTISVILNLEPSLIGITTTTPSFGIIADLVAKIHRALPDTAIILGGPHATGSPETTIKVSGVTAAVIGEGELTLLELINNIEGNKSIRDVRGIAYQGRDGEMVKTPARELIANLDELPLPARDLLPMDKYYSPPTKSLGGSRIANIVTSRGCPFHCTFCLSDMMWQGRYRKRSVAKVMEEIENCVNNYHCDEFNFNDDLFTADKKWVKDLCQAIIKKGLNIYWVAMSRTDYVTPEILEDMKAAGCRKIAMGLESGSKEVLRHMRKKIDLDKSVEAVRMIQKAGMQVGASFVLGHIGETAQTLKETIAFAKKLNPDTVAFFQASPYPGTEFYKMAKSRGYIRDDAEWIDYAIVTDKPSIVNLPGLPAENIHAWVQCAYRSFYLNPRYIFSRLKRINSWEAFLDNLKGARILFSILGKNNDE